MFKELYFRVFGNTHHVVQEADEIEKLLLARASYVRQIEKIDAQLEAHRASNEKRKEITG